MRQSRKERLNKLIENPEISVLIIGAGINGIGTFLDLALQGVDVVMIDRNDYCSGASSASSHMVHGGIRYLENGEFRLVREAVQERNRLLENAPHLVRQLPTTFPIFKRFSGLLNAPIKFLGLLDKPSERGALVIKIGMMLYDFYTRTQKTVPQHVFMNKTESLENFPMLNPEIIYTGTYYDGAMHSPERIAIEIISDAVEENKLAIPLNYTSAISVKGDTVTIRDEIDGITTTVKPKILINAGGPWIDQINHFMGHETDYIRGTKGSHIIIDNPELRKAIGENEFFFENNDGRIVLIYPLEDKILIGTSDIEVESPDQVVITDNEVHYFIDMIKKVFPTISVEFSQIVYAFSGVRPLTSSNASMTGQISRDHKIKIDEPGNGISFPIYSLIGGKWTTYRAFSEKACDLVLQKLGKDRVRSTTDFKLGGGKGFPKTDPDKALFFDSILGKMEISKDRLESLFSKYGTKVSSMLNHAANQKEATLKNYPDISVNEIHYIVSNEDVVHLDDLIFRRSMLGKLGRLTQDGLTEVCTIAAQAPGWDELKKKEEIKRVITILQTKHRMNFNHFISGNN